jgi:hypothetical protein
VYDEDKQIGTNLHNLDRFLLHTLRPNELRSFFRFTANDNTVSTLNHFLVDTHGRRRIFNLFLTSSVRSLAAFESSKRSFRTIRLGGPCGIFIGPAVGVFGERLLLVLPSVEDRELDEVEDGTVYEGCC